MSIVMKRAFFCGNDAVEEDFGKGLFPFYEVFTYLSHFAVEFTNDEILKWKLQNFLISNFKSINKFSNGSISKTACFLNFEHL
jgi:hypothetical protein